MDVMRPFFGASRARGFRLAKRRRFEMKITVFLRNDHEVLKSLFHRYKTPSGPRTSKGSVELVDEILREVRIHVQMEREIFYTALASAPSPSVPSRIAKAEQQLQTIEKLLRDVTGMNVSEKSFDTTMATLVEHVNRHIELDEEEIFDEARKILPEYRLEELGLEMEDRKKILSTLAA
jgi:hemerythrin-like domain-containing protein